MVETVMFDYIIPHLDLDLDNSTKKKTFSHDTLAHDAVLLYEVCLQKVQHLRKYHPDEYSLKF